MKRAVVVTGLDLRDLQGNVHGVYQRLRVMVEAVCTIVDTLSIFRIGAREIGGETDAESASELERHWGVRATVVTGSWARLPFARFWVMEQLLRAANYRRSDSFRGIDSPANRDILSRLLAQDTRVVIAHRLPMMEFVASAAPAGLPVLFDLDDVEHVALARQAQRIPNIRDRLFARLAVRAVRKSVERSISRADRTFVCSRHDQSMLQSTLRVAEGKLVVVPNTHMIRPRSPVADEPILLFVGTFAWQPNVDAVQLFLERCWPRIRGLAPSARFLVVGRNPEKIPSFGTSLDGVEFLGFVEDIDAVYRRARVVVCPIVAGGGTRVKLVEAAAYGKPIVSTTIGAEGLDFQNGVQALIADDMDEFARLSARLLVDDAQCARLSAEVHAHAQRNFSRARAIETVANAVRALAG